MISQYSNLWGYVRDLYQNAEFGETVDMSHIKQILYVSNFLVPLASLVRFRLSIILKLQKKRNSTIKTK